MTERLVGTNERGYRVGMYHHNAVHDDRVVDAVREMHETDGKGYRAIAKATGLPVSTVRDFCRYARRAQFYARWKAVAVVVVVQDE